ncbi:MAG: DNA-binding response regulator [Ponticaulis sp.]|nr:DNA-binding response regulator [Ponticaulis sp.]|tara:strand:- start:1096 stop:1746 length:651 start_codon:yes stop_codon:yes gene_type:complete
MKVLIADDHPIFRAGLRAVIVDLIEGADVRECSDGQALKSALQKDDYDLLILDVFFPALEPDADVRSFRQAYPTLAILVVSMLIERTAIERLMRAGANGFVSKSAAPELMERGILEVMEGERPIYLPSPGRGRPSRSGDNPVENLPPRQMEVLRLICLGLSNKEIARELNLSASTVRAHISALFQKLGVTSRAAAASFGAANGLWASSHQGDESGA